MNDRGASVVIVDADEFVPSVGPRLGLPIEPNIRTAVDAVEYGMGSLAAALVRHRRGFDVLSGIPNVAAWSEVRPGEVVDVLGELQNVYDVVVVNVSHGIEDLAGRRPGPLRRHAVGCWPRSRRSSASAPPGPSVWCASSVGSPTCVSSRETPIHLVVDRAPAEPLKRGEIDDEIRRTYPPSSLTFAPSDRRVEQAAWGGELVGSRGLRTCDRPRRRRPGRNGGSPVRRLRCLPWRCSQSRSCRSRRPSSSPFRSRSVVAFHREVEAHERTCRCVWSAIRRDVLARLERRRVRPESDLEQVRVEIGRAVDDYQRRAHLGEEMPLTDPPAMAERRPAFCDRLRSAHGAPGSPRRRRDLHRRTAGLVPRYRRASAWAALLRAKTENRQIVDRLLAATERQLNARHPIVQARVLNGTARLTAAIPPVGDQLSATLRRYTVRDVTLDDLVRRDSLSPEAANFLTALMQMRSRITVSGEPGAGKTTLAAALLAAGPANHCVRSCEEIREITVPVTHGAYYEVRPPAIDGTGEISLRDLVKFVLAMRPDRIVVGEVRGAEAFELAVRSMPGAGSSAPSMPTARRGAERAGQRGAHGGRERHRADRAARCLRVPRPRRPPRP